MTRHGWVGDVGQAEFAEEAAFFFLGQFAALARGQEALQGKFQRFVTQDLGLERFPDQ